MHRWLTYDRADGSYKTKNHGTLLDADGSNFLSERPFEISLYTAAVNEIRDKQENE